jgi:dTMP kinase
MKPKRLKQGIFIALSGPDGSGKSTQACMLGNWLSSVGYDVLVTKEPGGDAVCADIRKILVHDAHDTRYDPPIADGRVELFLFCADRRQHVVSTIYPALRARRIVICDRYVPDTYAYQCKARRAVEPFEFKYIMDRAITVGDMHIPDLTLWFKLDPEIGIARKILKKQLDRFEAEESSFHIAVADGFADFFKRWPEYRHVCIDATHSEKDISEEIKKHVKKLISRVTRSRPAS